MEVALPPTVSDHIFKKLRDTSQSTTLPHLVVHPFHAKNRHYCKLRLRFLKGYDMQKINI